MLLLLVSRMLLRTATMTTSRLAVTAYTFTDWEAGIDPPSGWDVADALRDGWTCEEYDAFIGAMIEPFVPKPRLVEASPPAGKPVVAATPTASEPAPVADLGVARAAKAGTPIGHQGASNLPQVCSLNIGSEVEIAQIMAHNLSKVCGGSVVMAEGRFWAFGPTAWQEIPDQILRLAVHRFDGAAVLTGKSTMFKVGKRAIDGVLSEVGTILAAPGFFDSPTIGVNAANGVITIDDAGKVNVRPHNPDDRFRFTISAGFHLHTDMVPPEGSLLHKLVVGAFAGDADAQDKINLLGEMLGAAAFGLATRLLQPKAFVFLGETASNGKSTAAGLLSRLLPAGSVSSIPPGAFADERRIVNLAGKAANVADELSAAAISGETFKAAITGDPIEGRDLYRSAVTFVPRALHVFTTNTLPRFNGGLDRGLQRRLVVLRFNRSIPQSEIIPDIAERIQQNEMELLLGFAVGGAQRLIRNRGYTIPASSRDALRSWLLLDPLNEWFEARTATAEAEPYNGWPTIKALFDDFKKWALEQGHAERFLPPINTFSQRLKAFPNVQIRRSSKGSFTFGLKLAGGSNW